MPRLELATPEQLNQPVRAFYGPIARRLRIPETLYLEGVHWFLRGQKAKFIAEIWNCPVRTVLDVIASPEWGYTCDLHRDDVMKSESAVLTSLIGKALEATALRLERGDPKVLKDGEIVYAPVKARDAAAIAAVFMERRRDLHKKMDGVPDEANAAGEIERLFNVAQKLMAMKRDAKPAEKDVTPAPTDNSAIIDVESIDRDEDED